MLQYKVAKKLPSLPTRGAWIEIDLNVDIRHCPPSLPTRGAWIEIWEVDAVGYNIGVAPHTGSVD